MPATRHPLIRASFGYCRDPAGRLLMVGNEYSARGVLWGVPGGRMEAGESPSECLVREFREEVGLDVTVRRSCGTIRRTKPEWELNLFCSFYEVDWCAGAPRIDPNEEHVVAFQFLHRHEIAAFPAMVLGRRYILDYLDNPRGVPKHILMAPDEE